MEQTEENEKALHDYLMNLYLDGSLENAKELLQRGEYLLMSKSNSVY